MEVKIIHFIDMVISQFQQNVTYLINTGAAPFIDVLKIRCLLLLKVGLFIK